MDNSTDHDCKRIAEIQGCVLSEIEESNAVNKGLSEDAATKIAKAACIITQSLKEGNKLIAFGNGGSAADAQHMVAEFVGRYRAEREALAAIALTTNSSSITAIGNDYGFEEIFSRQIEAIGKPGDVVLAISASGNSGNVLRGVEFARNASLSTIGLSGRTGGRMRELVDVCVCVPSDSTPRIQEAHGLIVHILCGIVEKAFLPAHSTVKSTN